MKSIELTKEHKSKLLEMCNKLFPEYKEIILTKQKCLNFGFKDHGSYTTKIADMSIHWFEFCMTHLSNKIINTYWECHLNQKHYKSNLLEEFSDFYLSTIDCNTNIILNQQIHPIDYLYEEFKKLKL